MSKKVEIEGLNVYYKQGRLSLHAAKDVDINIDAGEIVALIGESGSGKTTVAKAMLGHLPFFANKVSINNLEVPSSPLLINEKFRRKFATISQMIYQSPSASLNHHKRVWKVVAEGMYNIKFNKKEWIALADERQRHYNTKILNFSKKLNSKILEKKKSEFYDTLEKINKANKHYLVIDKSKTSILSHEDLVKMDFFYGDQLSNYKNLLDQAFNKKEYETKLRKIRTKKFFVAKFRAKEATMTKKEKNQKTDNALDKINSDYKKALATIKAGKEEHVKKFKATRDEIVKAYKNMLNEFASKRKTLIKNLKVSQKITNAREKKAELKNEIATLYKKGKEQDAEIFQYISQVAKKQGLEKEYNKHFSKYKVLLEEDLKYKKRPFGSKAAIKKKAFDLLVQVGLTRNTGYSFSSQLSGGQQQRVAIARAFSMNPQFIVADEPIASLDVSLQGSIINLIKKLATNTGTSVLFISHDLEMTRRIANRTLVMYKGRIVEKGNTEDIFKNPIHPYTKMLVSSSKTIAEALAGKEIRTYKASDHRKGGNLAWKKIKAHHYVWANDAEVNAWRGGK